MAAMVGVSMDFVIQLSNIGPLLYTEDYRFSQLPVERSEPLRSPGAHLLMPFVLLCRTPPAALKARGLTMLNHPHRRQ